MDDVHRAHNTTLVRRVSDADSAGGDGDAAAALFAVVYDRLHRLAQSFFSRQRADHTLQPTALVHEAYLKLVDHDALGATDHAHFVRIAARAMRQILVDHARGHGRQKRGGAWQRITLAGVAAHDATDALDLLALDDAMTALADAHPRPAAVVELRFFGGLSVEAVAMALDVSPRTVELDWRLAKAWLDRALAPDTEDAAAGE